MLSMEAQSMKKAMRQRGFCVYTGAEERLDFVVELLKKYDIEDFHELGGLRVNDLCKQIVNDGFEAFSEKEQAFLERMAVQALRKCEGQVAPVARSPKRVCTNARVNVAEKAEPVRCELKTVVNPAPAACPPVEAIVDMIMKANSNVHKVHGLGPMKALQALPTGSFTEKQCAEWVERARVNAIAGCCPKSHASLFSGLRCWVAFAQRQLKLRGREFPPKVPHLIAWSALFRCKGTFLNYVNYVRIGCEILGCSTEAFLQREVKRAGMAIMKRGQFWRRQPMFIKKTMLMQIMDLARSEGYQSEAMLYLATYTFLLRVPSEALPMVCGGRGVIHGQHSVLFLGINCIYLKLATRKNRPAGSLLKRSCWCAKCAATCPVHVLGKYLDEFAIGNRLFAGFSPGLVLSRLRRRLGQLGVADASSYRAHDFRRGHAQDLRESGASLKEILTAGEWRSPAFLAYLDLESLEHDFVLQAHLDESDDEVDKCE